MGSRRASALLAGLLGLSALAPAVGQAGDPSEAPGAAAGACAEDMARRVQAHYEGVRDLRARFTQTTRSVAFGEAGAGAEEPVGGEVVLAKPGRMHWRYTGPEPSVVVSDGKTLWIYDPVAGEVQVMPMTEGFLSGAALQFLLGDGRLLDSFRVEASACGKPTVDLLLHPREPASYEMLGLRVDAASGAVRETTVTDLFGNRTSVVFSEMKTNQAPADALFRLVPPEGTRVLQVAPEP